MSLQALLTYDFIERPRAQIPFKKGGLLQCAVFSDGTQITPTNPLITVLRPGGAPCTTPVGTQNSDSTYTGTAAGFAADNKTMNYTLTAGNADILVGQFGAYAPWTAEWTFTFNAVTYDALQVFDVVRYPLRPVVTQADLQTLHPDLTDSLYSTETASQPYITIAWDAIYSKLINAGNRPYIILDNESLRWPLAHLALHYYFAARARTGNGQDRWSMLRKYHFEEFERWYTSTAFNYDLDQTGTLIPGEVNRKLTQAYLRV